MKWRLLVIGNKQMSSAKEENSKSHRKNLLSTGVLKTRNTKICPYKLKASFKIEL